MVELRVGNMKSRDVRGNQHRRDCYNEKPDLHFGTDFLNTFQGIPVRSKSETCVEGLEHAVCIRSGVINNKLTKTGFGIDYCATNRKLEHETILDEGPVVIDKNDNETSVDSGISINLTNFEDIKDAEDTKFIHPRAKTILDERRRFDDGDVREKSVGCLPVPSASESFRQLRQRKRSRSLSISSVGISRKVRWMVALVCATFILAWFPFFAVILVNMFCDSCALNYFLNAAIMVAFSKSMANPVVYALCHVEFRRAYGKVFKACGCKPCC
ncbi:hypothetical protein EGW08_013497 [Elysia chlorotica]|uniref:G-protein coupled receptors family 1 profile domain-containing protein n=1 Tax=Elysia chlorotica TaxID=188477 RepID=A0A433TB26_ELYCH|nr:hypothetical protein EGW08_013497 [Elysia chlorotica]